MNGISVGQPLGLVYNKQNGAWEAILIVVTDNWLNASVKQKTSEYATYTISPSISQSFQIIISVYRFLAYGTINF